MKNRIRSCEHEIAFWLKMGYFFYTQVSPDDLSSWNDYRSLDLDRDSLISTYEVVQVVDHEMEDVLNQECQRDLFTGKYPETKKVLDFFEALSGYTPHSRQLAFQMAREWVQRESSYFAWIKLKKLEACTDRMVESLHLVHDPLDRDEHLGLHEDIARLNRRLGLIPTNPLYFTCNPSMELFFVDDEGDKKDEKKEVAQEHPSDTAKPDPSQEETEEKPELGLLEDYIAGRYWAWNKYHVEGPFQQIGLKSYARENRRGARIHEASHALFHEPLFRNSTLGWDAVDAGLVDYQFYPWLQEGFAEWASEGGIWRVLNPEYLVESAHLKLDSYELRVKSWLPNNATEYYRGYFAFKFLEDSYGLPRTQEFIRHLMEGYNLDEALTMAFGLAKDDFYEQELRWTQGWLRRFMPPYYDPRFQRVMADYVASGEKVSKKDDEWVVFLNHHPDNARDMVDLVLAYPGTPFSTSYAYSLTNALRHHEDELSQATGEVITRLEEKLAEDDIYEAARDGMVSYHREFYASLHIDPEEIDPLKPELTAHIFFWRWCEAKMKQMEASHDMSFIRQSAAAIDKERAFWSEWTDDNRYYSLSPYEERYLFYVHPLISGKYQDVLSLDNIPDFIYENQDPLFMAMTFVRERNLISDEEFIAVLEWYLEFFERRLEKSPRTNALGSSIKSQGGRELFMEILARNDEHAKEVARRLLRGYPLDPIEQDFTKRLEKDLERRREKKDWPLSYIFSKNDEQVFVVLATACQILEGSDQPEDIALAGRYQDLFFISTAYPGEWELKQNFAEDIVDLKRERKAILDKWAKEKVKEILSDESKTWEEKKNRLSDPRIISEDMAKDSSIIHEAMATCDLNRIADWIDEARLEEALTGLVEMMKFNALLNLSQELANRWYDLCWQLLRHPQVEQKQAHKLLSTMDSVTRDDKKSYQLSRDKFVADIEAQWQRGRDRPTTLTLACAVIAARLHIVDKETSIRRFFSMTGRLDYSNKEHCQFTVDMFYWITRDADHKTVMDLYNRVLPVQRQLDIHDFDSTINGIPFENTTIKNIVKEDSEEQGLVFIYFDYVRDNYGPHDLYGKDKTKKRMGGLIDYASRELGLTDFRSEFYGIVREKSQPPE